MSEEKKTYAIDAFLSEIVARREDRGFMAELRRGLSASTESQAWPHIARYAAVNFTDDVKRRIWVVVGALAATLAPDGLLRKDGFASVGNVARRLRSGSSPQDESGIKAYEPKFRRMLNSSDALDLCELVAELGRSAANKGIEINCRALFWDLWKWDDAEEREKIRVRWARDFYGVFEKNGCIETKEDADE